MKTLYKQQNIPLFSGYKATYYEAVEHNGKKFLIYIEGSNGDYVGFNKKACISVMGEDGDWKHVVDNKKIGFNVDKFALFYGNDVVKKKSIITNAVKKFKDYIEKVY